MDGQYRIVNECLLLLKQSEMPIINKLSVEAQLIQLKRLILRNEDASSDLKCLSCGDDVFRKLLCQMQRICADRSARDDLTDFTDHLGYMLTALGGNPTFPSGFSCFNES